MLDHQHQHAEASDHELSPRDSGEGEDKKELDIEKQLINDVLPWYPSPPSSQFFSLLSSLLPPHSFFFLPFLSSLLFN
jgi:hypothetical protein